jgi:hypothetical protein
MEKFTAQQAAQLAKKNEQPIDQILKTIENQAGYGNRYIMCAYLPDEVLLEFVELGYAVSKFTDPFGVEQTKIRW